VHAPASPEQLCYVLLRRLKPLAEYGGERLSSDLWGVYVGKGGVSKNTNKTTTPLNQRQTPLGIEPNMICIETQQTVSVAPPYIKHQSWYIASLKALAHDPVSTVWTISSPPYMDFIYNLTSGNFEINPLILP